MTIPLLTRNPNKTQRKNNMRLFASLLLICSLGAFAAQLAGSPGARYKAVRSTVDTTVDDEALYVDLQNELDNDIVTEPRGHAETIHYLAALEHNLKKELITVEYMQALAVKYPDLAQTGNYLIILGDLYTDAEQYPEAIAAYEASLRYNMFSKLARMYRIQGDGVNEYECYKDDLLTGRFKNPKGFANMKAKAVRVGLKSGVASSKIKADMKSVAAIYPPEGADIYDPAWVKALSVFKYRIDQL